MNKISGATLRPVSIHLRQDLGHANTDLPVYFMQNCQKFTGENKNTCLPFRFPVTDRWHCFLSRHFAAKNPFSVFMGSVCKNPLSSRCSVEPLGLVCKA